MASQERDSVEQDSILTEAEVEAENAEETVTFTIDSSAFGLKFKGPGIGLKLRNYRGRIVVRSVERDSPAYNAGLRKNMQLIEINSVAVQSIPGNLTDFINDLKGEIEVDVLKPRQDQKKQVRRKSIETQLKEKSEKRKRDYASHPTPEKNRQKAAYAAHPTPAKERSKAAYAADPTRIRRKRNARYAMDPRAEKKMRRMKL